ncbi:hypothetical protein [Fluviicola sp.]|jgi:hypothetical protein|uniref:hypothetical protein n=1 Tax=Fluviicola sp. TaxID=1917219 RepID=UPI002823815E|nr:hypothetical protein [Fluviicola sp.]MDR0801651.1 hypothetical protein [Fluviicola sp.]
MNKFGFILFSISFFLSCTQKKLSDYEKIELFCRDHSNISQLDHYKRVIVINSKGTCINCNNRFARMVSEKTNDRKSLFIIAESGTKVDISGFIDRKYDNVILDYNAEFDQLGLTSEGCTVFDLNKGKITKKQAISIQNVGAFEI